MTSIFTHSAMMGGKWIPLSQYKPKVTLIVNTASLCSFTASNIHQLNELQRTYGPRGFTVLAFPCAQFANQEPLSPDGLKAWTADNAITFPVFDRVNVVLSKPDVHPLFEVLQRELGPIRWNYTKFLCDRSGTPMKKFQPVSLSLESEIEKYL
ncbi:glutathione peroxidase [Angomonas deanei]|nr:glutathione peroxidase [Angomonas deanei]|eukprot:EPY39380.1 glutathione peroxidase [Angomonas deanei]